MSLGESIRSGAKWLVAGSVGNQVLQFAFGVVLARLLVPADFGMILTVQIFTGFAGTVLSGGMGQSLIRAKEADERDFNAIFTLQLALGILIYLIFFLTAPFISAFFNDPLYTDLIRVSTVSFLLRPFSLMYKAWLNREMNFKILSLVAFLTGVVTGSFSVTMAWFGMGVWSLVFAGIIGALFSNLLLGRLLPIRLKLHPNFTKMRKHSSYGFKITVNDFLGNLTRESKTLILSKFGGPAFLGLFNKGESLSITPNKIIMPSTMKPFFRAMSKVQDDLDQTKYMFYRAIALLTVYTMPFYVGLWWIAEPFIGFVYGEKWLPSAEPLRILAISGIFYSILFPSGVLLDAQNKLTQEMIIKAMRLVVVIAACFIGLNWGLVGVAWGILFGNLFGACTTYYLVYRTINTRLVDLVKAITPGILLGTLLFAVLAMMHFALGEHKATAPFLYILTMTITGAVSYGAAFLLLPIPALHSEASRWRSQIRNAAKSIVMT